MSYDIPILFLIFNRPEKASKVMSRIKEIQPKTLFIAADGPRNENESLITTQTRKKVMEMVDWECKVQTLFRDDNLGCKKAVGSAIDWFFNNVDMGIILEDDCLPKIDFFSFCKELLIKYKFDTRVSSISGSNPYHVDSSLKSDYYFSNFNRIWGWASWRRSWKSYDVNMEAWPEVKRSKAHYSFFRRYAEIRHFEKIWDECYHGLHNTWDYQWFFEKRMQSSMTIISKFNLIENLGFDADSTHTIKKPSYFVNNEGTINKNLIHPDHVLVNYELDRNLSRLKFSTFRTYKRIVIDRVKKILK